MPRLPPVPISPQARLLLRLRPGEMPSVVTLLQSHSSSSATSCAMPVSVPCPISERAIRITQVSSGLIATQMLTSVAAPCACAASTPHGTFNPSARPPPAPAPERHVQSQRQPAAGDGCGTDDEVATRESCAAGNNNIFHAYSPEAR